MEALLSLLLFVFFFIVFISRIVKFIIRVFSDIEEKNQNTSGSEKETSSSRQKSPKTSRPAPGSRKGPPPGFDLDLSEIDDKFGEKREERNGETKKKPEVLESDSVREYKARQQEKEKKNKEKLARSKSRQKSVISSGEIGRGNEIGHSLNFDNKSLINGIMMKEILSPPRSLKPYKPVYKDKE